MAANLLYKAFIENSRTRAKNVYREIMAGKTVGLTTVEMEDKSTIRFDIALDCSEYRGTLNFGAFRSNLTQLIGSFGESLKNKEPVPIFTAQNDSEEVIFGVTALSQEAGHTNIMVLSADMSPQRPSVLLKLMYLDHEQFAANAASQENA
jgi:hypothetical protein